MTPDTESPLAAAARRLRAVHVTEPFARDAQRARDQRVPVYAVRSASASAFTAAAYRRLLL